LNHPDDTDGTMFIITFHPSHVLGGLPPNLPYKLRIYANKEEADQTNLVAYFIFWCEGKYYHVSAFEVPKGEGLGEKETMLSKRLPAC